MIMRRSINLELMEHGVLTWLSSSYGEKDSFQRKIYVMIFRLFCALIELWHMPKIRDCYLISNRFFTILPPYVLD